MLPDAPDGTRRCQLDQIEHTESLCTAYMEERGLKNLRSISTPLPTREKGGTDEYLKQGLKTEGVAMADKVRKVLKDIGLAQLPEELPPDPALYDQPRGQANTAASHVLSMLFVGRGTRPEAMAAINRLAGRLSKWSKFEDELLERLLRYIWHTRYLVLQQEVRPGDARILCTLAHVDSDHGGDMVDTKATTGFAVSIDRLRSHYLTSWAAKQQPVTAKSTGDAEASAMSGCVASRAEALRTMMEQLYQRKVWCVVRSDADVAISAVRKGYSRKMSYLGRAQRVSLGFLHDYLGCEQTCLDKVPWPTNDADVLTKGLDHTAHWRHAEALGMRATVRFPSAAVSVEKADGAASQNAKL